MISVTGNINLFQFDVQQFSLKPPRTEHCELCSENSNECCELKWITIVVGDEFNG
jgi:hypothetical protein